MADHFNLIDQLGASMEITDLLVKSGQLMAVGMLVVFGFLGILVFCTKLLSRLVQKYLVEEPTPATTAALPASEGQVSPQTVAAISAAIHQYRQNKQ